VICFFEVRPRKDEESIAMRKTGFIVAAVVGLSLGLSLGATDSKSDEPWKNDARSCSQMSGTPGQVYKSTCQTQDQFDSILACEQAAGDQEAAQRIRMAGRDDVNTYMQGFGPIEGCK
jgi:hypothetical protein